MQYTAKSTRVEDQHGNLHYIHNSKQCWKVFNRQYTAVFVKPVKRVHKQCAACGR